MVRILNGAERSIKGQSVKLEPAVLGFMGERPSTLTKLIKAKTGGRIVGGGVVGGGVVGGSIVKHKPHNKRSSQIEKMANSEKGARKKKPNVVGAGYPTKVITTRRIAERKPRKKKSKSIVSRPLSGGGLVLGQQPLISGRASDPSGRHRLSEQIQGSNMMLRNSLIAQQRL